MSPNQTKELNYMLSPMQRLGFALALCLAAATTSPATQSGDSYLIHTVAGGGGRFEDNQPLPGRLWHLSSSDFTKGMAADHSGSVYFSSAGRVYRLSRNGLLTPVAGNGQFGSSGDGGPALQAQLAGPGGVAVDGQGNLYVAETHGHRVRKVTLDGRITTPAGNGIAGFGGDGGVATGAQLNDPRDVAVDGMGNIYIADYGNFRIRKVDSSGVISTVAGNGTFAYTGDGGAATAASLTPPTCVAVSPAGHIYFNDFFNHRIRRVDTGGIITTVAGSGPAGIDNGGFSGDGGQATQARLFGPMDVAIDATGNLYIADQRNRRIRKVSPNGVIHTMAGTGQLGETGDGGPALAANLEDPQGIEVDAAGNVFIATGQFPTLIRLLSPEPLPLPTSPLKVETSSLPMARVGQPYFTFLVAEGGQPFIYRWALTSGSLPSGITLDPTTGILSGPPGTVGSFDFAVEVADRSQNTAMESFTLNVEAAVAAGTPLTIVTPSPLPRAQVGQPYSVRLEAEGAPPPITWSRVTNHPLAPGSLPQGLSLDPATGIISGTPQETFSSPFAIRASHSQHLYTDKIFQIPIDSPPPVPPFLVSLPIEVASIPRSVTSVPGVAWDLAGNIFVSDFEQARILKLAPTGEVTAAAGTGTAGFSGDGGPAAQARVDRPAGLVFDAAGNLYFADMGNQRVRRVSVIGTVSTVAGTGRQGSRGDGGVAAAAELSNPWGLAFDHQGNLYIADSGNHRVRKVTPAGIISTVAGTGTAGFSGDGGPAVAAQLSGPLGVAADRLGNLYIADSDNHRIRRVSPSGSIVTIAGNGRTEFSGDGGPATAASLQYPFGVTVDSTGRVFVPDTFHHRLRQITADGKIQTVATAFHASSAAIDQAGNIAIGGSHRAYLLPATFPSQPVVSIVTPANLPAGQVDEPYSTYLLAEGSVPFNYVWTVAQGALPDGLALDQATGRISGTAGRAGTFTFTAEVRDYTQTRVSRAFTLVIRTSPAGDTWILNPYAGTTRDGRSHGGYIGEGLAAESALLNPTGVTIDKSGNLWIADTGNHRVRKVSQTGVITTVAGNGTTGYSGDGGPATEAQLNSPVDVSVDERGNLFIAEGQAIRQVAPDGRISTVAGGARSGFDGDGGPATQASLSCPRSVEVDSNGNLYIADLLNHRIRKVSADGTMQTIAGSGSVDSAGSQGGGYYGDGGPATSALLRYPRGIALDSAGNLYIADSWNHRIRRVTPAGTIDTLAGTGIAGSGGDGGPARQAQLRFPEAVEVERDGNLLIADLGNRRIRRVTSDGIIHTIAGVGSAGFSGDRGPATAAQLAAPSGVAIDSLGSIYLSDADNHQIRTLTRGRLDSQPEPLFTWILPSSARARGLAGAFFTTDLTIANVGSRSATIEVRFLGNNRDGRIGPVKTVEIAAGRTATYRDVLATLFGLTEDWGALHIASDSSDLAIQGQTSTPAPSRLGGTYGQCVPASASKDWIRAGLPRMVPGVREDALFRTNLILANVTQQPLEVGVRLLSSGGEELGSRRVELPPLGMTQLTRVAQALEVVADFQAGQLVLSTPTPGGSFAGYAAVIDNTTNDPRTLLPQWQGDFPFTWVVPSSARGPGVGGTFYTTDLSITSTVQHPLRFGLSFLGHDRNGLVGPSQDFTLAPNQTLFLADVLSSVFHLNSDFGAIQLHRSSVDFTLEPGAVTQAQTSTPASGGGTFGQSVPGVPLAGQIRLGVSRSIVGVEESLAFRTNLILANATEAQAEVDLLLLNAEGVVLGSRRVTLQPLGMTQLNRVVRALGVTDEITDARLLLSTTTPLIGFTAYAALIDNATGDPRTLLPQ
ncbi:MAG: putative Ig domain-containing protein [Acidobacteriota bacterium]